MQNSFYRIGFLTANLLIAMASKLSAQYTFERLPENPVITPEMFVDAGYAAKGANINGPSLIRIPAAVPSNERADPSANYYLYFADHSGDEIKMAWASEVAGPYTLYAPNNGVLSINRPNTFNINGDKVVPATSTLGFGNHIASPDVHWDAENSRFIMFFHGFEFVRLGNGVWDKTDQKTFIASSADGLDFNDSFAPRTVGPSYMRVFDWNGGRYASSFHTMRVSQDPDDWFADFSVVTNEHGSMASARHTALQVAGDDLYVFFTRKGDAPERILMSRIRYEGDPNDWIVGAPAEILRPTEVWEGSEEPIVASTAGGTTDFVNQLRDPYFFTDFDGEEYLLYSVAGEQGIAITRNVSNGIPLAPVGSWVRSLDSTANENPHGDRFGNESVWRYSTNPNASDWYDSSGTLMKWDSGRSRFRQHNSSLAAWIHSTKFQQYGNSAEVPVVRFTNRDSPSTFTVGGRLVIAWPGGGSDTASAELVIAKRTSDGLTSPIYEEIITKEFYGAVFFDRLLRETLELSLDDSIILSVRAIGLGSTSSLRVDDSEMFIYPGGLLLGPEDADGDGWSNDDENTAGTDP